MADKYWYRAEVWQYADYGLDEWGAITRSVPTPRVEIREYRVLKETPKGLWLEPCGARRKRFVLTDARKRFAAPTRIGAVNDLVARKKAQLRHAKDRLDRAVRELSAAENYVGKQQ